MNLALLLGILFWAIGFGGRSTTSIKTRIETLQENISETWGGGGTVKVQLLLKQGLKLKNMVKWRIFI